MRVSQRQMYSSLLYNMNGNLSAYMKTQEQMTTQKKVNRPSDDPYGSAQIMASYQELSSITQYKDNLSMSKGWLNAAESALGQVQTQMERVIAIMQQAASGTYDGNNRKTIADEMRQIMEQMVSYGNTKFNERYIFGGHKTDSSPYEMTMGAYSRDAGMANVRYEVTGDLSKSAIVQFTQTDLLSNQPTFRYSLDSGATWVNGTWSGNTMQCGPDVDITLHNITGVTATAITDYSSMNETGTWVYVHPAAQYKGDTNEPTVVQSYPYNDPVTGSASGVFKRDVSVRIDDIVGGNILYSYSTDDGISWTAGSAPDTAPRKLPVQGGFLSLDASPTIGSQFVIRPHRADIDLTIGENASITINNVGLDIFGGLYAKPFGTEGAQPYPEDLNKNLFEVLGQAVAFLETNSQTGAQEILDRCLKIDAHVGQSRTTIGARLNRVDAVKYQLDSLNLDVNDRLSTLEDADLSELMVKLSQQDLAYKSVLQSSSMIMQISLMNYL